MVVEERHGRHSSARIFRPKLLKSSTTQVSEYTSLGMVCLEYFGLISECARPSTPYTLSVGSVAAACRVLTKAPRRLVLSVRLVDKSRDVDFEEDSLLQIQKVG